MEPRANAVTLVRAAQRGDRSAFARLYDEYAGLVRATAVTRLRGDEAADVVQETFLRALRRLKSLRKAEAFAGWIVAIARNIIRDVERARMMFSSSDEEPGEAPTQELAMDAGAAMRAIHALPRAYQQTVAMRVVEGMTGPEIAKRTGLSAGSVRVNLHRGMRLLRARLKAAVSLRTVSRRSRSRGRPPARATTRV
jgi:RNA polymerase sigma-70 factor (ECF subfamily)